MAISLFIPLFVNSYFISSGLCKGNPGDNTEEMKRECRRAYVLAAGIIPPFLSPSASRPLSSTLTPFIMNRINGGVSTRGSPLCAHLRIRIGSIQAIQHTFIPRRVGRSSGLPRIQQSQESRRGWRKGQSRGLFNCVVIGNQSDWMYRVQFRAAGQGNCR